MRRFGRIFWTTFAGVSLLLCAAAAGVWVRSYFVNDVVTYRAGDRRWIGDVRRGRLGIVRLDIVLGSSLPMGDEGWRHDAAGVPGAPLQPSEYLAVRWAFDHAGFAFASNAIDLRDRKFGTIDIGIDQVSVRILVVHLAYPTALFALAPLAWLAGFVRRRRRNRRARIGVCRQCGYDLRASPGRCPECGTVPAR